jgi:hypothetical protein
LTGDIAHAASAGRVVEICSSRPTRRPNIAERAVIQLAID